MKNFQIFRQAVCLVFIFLSSQVFSQAFLNGNFETNTANPCDYNLPNGTYTGKMSNSTGYGGANELDIMGTTCPYGTPQNGNWFVGLAGFTDAFTMRLSQPLIQGVCYKITFWDKGTSAYPPAPPAVIGLSTLPNTAGTNIYNGPVPTLDFWNQRTFTFVAPNNGQYISVAVNVWRWLHVDNFTISSCAFTVGVVGGAVCPGGCKTLTASPSGGTVPYTYSWNPGGATTVSINACPTANTVYSVTVTDLNGLTTSTTAAVTISSAMTTGSTVVNVKCNGGATGSATASVNGGTNPYTYSWSNGKTTVTTTGLTGGNYSFTVTDAAGCTKTGSAIITDPPLLTTATSAVNISCNGAGNGSTSVTANGGTGNYTYSWNPSGQLTQSATGLNAGTYTVTVTDANACTKTGTVTVTQPSLIAPTVTVTAATCTSGGTATVSTNGGTGTYTYLWNNGQATQTATGLAQGNYTVTVTDANNCSKTVTCAITGISGPSSAGMSNVTAVLCNGGNTGTATASATGGTGALTYVWSNGQNSANATGLSAGTYTVVVSDVNGCTITATVNVTEPTAVVAIATGINACSNATANGNGAGGTGGYTYLWSNGQTLQNATGLGTGIYTLTVTDANGCTAQDTAVINVSVAPIVVFTADDTSGCAALCVNFTCTNANIASYTWDFGDGIGSGSPASHCYKTVGTYTVTLTVKDNNGCTGSASKANYITVFPNVVASFTAGPQPTTVLNPLLQFSDQSTGGAISWDWSFGDILNSTSTLQNPSFTYKDSGCYNVQLIADNQYNCPDTSKGQVCIQGDYQLFGPNAFTPDGDGLNDVWNVKGIGIDAGHFELYIFDRWGNMIFKTTDLYEGWNGRANGGRDLAQLDVYVWKVFAKDFLGKKHNYIGHVSLIR